MKTYDEPGNCPKCGAARTYLDWQETHRISQPDSMMFRSVGHLAAVCRPCGYEWAVIPKDEAS